MRWALKKFGDIAKFLPSLRHHQFATVFGLEGGLFIRILKPVFTIDKTDGIGLAGGGKKFAATWRVFALIACGARMDGLHINRPRQPVGQFQIEPLRRTPTNPLAIADHDVESGLFIAKIEKDLILIR